MFNCILTGQYETDVLDLLKQAQIKQVCLVVLQGFAELHGRDVRVLDHESSDFFEPPPPPPPQIPTLNQATTKTLLPKLNPRIKTFKPPKNPSIIPVTYNPENPSREDAKEKTK